MIFAVKRTLIPCVKNNKPKITNSTLFELNTKDNKNIRDTKREIAPTIILGMSSTNSFSNKYPFEDTNTSPHKLYQDNSNKL